MRILSREPVGEDRASVDRASLIRQQRLRVVMQAGVPEVSRGDLSFERPFGIVEHTADGRLFGVKRGEIDDATGAVAFYVNAAGDVVLLERAPWGPQTVDELAAKRAERDARAAAPKPRPPG